MTAFRHLETGVDLPVPARYVVGRSRVCQLQIHSANVSALHAEVAWSGSEWQLRDLGSRNGTFVASQRVPTGQRAKLTKGVEIGFGAPDAQYCFVDDSPPQLIAFGPHGVQVGADGLLCLPSRHECEAMVFCNADECWVVETAEGTRPLEPEDHLLVGGRPFQIHLPGGVPRTQDVEGRRDDAGDGGVFELLVSRDGEHVELRVREADRIHAIGARAHGFLLLALARARLDDRSNGDLPESEHGWVHREDLMKELMIDDPQHLNLWVHRARQQLAQWKLRDASKIIERRERAGQLRFGLERVRIIEA